MTIPNAQRGFSLIEVIFGISIAVLLIVSIGRTLIALERAPRVSAARQEANQAAQTAIEAVTGLAESLYGCRCSVDTCGGSTCTRAADGASCTMMPSYRSCWTAFPAGMGGTTAFALTRSGSAWSLTPLGGSVEVLRAEPYLARRIEIVTAERNAAFELETGGTPDPNMKLVTVTVTYATRGGTASDTYRTLVTGWKSL
jgi:prepilin-type N-terminal cleavage/methylation domain-containing protein